MERGVLVERPISCPFRKSYPDVLMVQPGQDWDGDNDTGPLDRPAQRRILAQRQVRARLIVVRRIRSKNSPQVRLAKDQHSIQALAAHGADQAFRIAILPGRSRRDRSVADSRLIVSYFVGGRDGEYAMVCVPKIRLCTIGDAV